VFDVSFSELLVIAVVALLVIGPEKLPKVARTIGALTGRMQRYVGQVKEEVNRELRFEELQKLQQEIKQSVESAQSNIQHQAAEIESAILVQNEPTVKPEPVTAQKPARKPRVAKPSLAASKKATSAKTSTKKVET
jgi:sec-independent protein translocase protein TatB